MSVLTFKGGVDPFGKKKLSSSKKIQEYLPVGNVIIPICQHVGSPAKVCVKVGDRVLQNQLIAKATDDISANIHSSVSGVVTEIAPVKVCGGESVNAIHIENDHLYEKVKINDFRSPGSLSSDEKIKLIKKAGVVGMGGAGFPTHIKLSPSNPNKIRRIIVNATECEPYITADYRLMVEETDKIIKGLREILSIFDRAKGIIAVEDNKLDVIAKFKANLRGTKDIEVKEVFTKYPQGGERQLIYALTGKEISSDKTPADVNCIVLNVDTVYEIYNALYNKEPVISRIISVTGEGIRKPQNFKALIGTNINELIVDAGGMSLETSKIISGGPMMGVALPNANFPITKTTTAIVVLKNDESAVKESNCINCGRCVSACPSRLVPAFLAKAARKNDKEKFIKYNGMECIECGCCSYICPANINLTQSIKFMRKDILASDESRGDR